MPAMKPFFLSQRPILAPKTAFGPETAVFCLETAPPFGAGASLDVVGVEFRRPGASPAAPGAALRQPGAAPISCTEAPAAWSGAPIARSGHPGAGGVDAFYGSAGTPTRITKPAGKSARAPLGAALCPQPFALCFA